MIEKEITYRPIVTDFGLSLNKTTRYSLATSRTKRVWAKLWEVKLAKLNNPYKYDDWEAI